MPLFVSCHPDGCYLSAEPESDRAIPVQLDPQHEEPIRQLLAACDSFRLSAALGEMVMWALNQAGAANRKPLPKPDHVVTS